MTMVQPGRVMPSLSLRAMVPITSVTIATASSSQAMWSSPEARGITRRRSPIKRNACFTLTRPTCARYRKHVQLTSMSWDALSLLAPPEPARPRIERSARPLRRGATTFYEVAAKTIIEATPEGWAVSPYRGCAAACLYCSARRGHRYLGLDPLADFGSRIVVKTNAARRLRAELPRFVRDHPGEPIQLGVTGDCYQPAEELYRLMPGVIAALRDHGVPVTVLTRRTGVLRDLDALAAAAEVCEVTAQVSVGFVDDRIRRALEPEGPTPQQRLELCARLGEAGVPCGVVMAPILPCLTDSPDQLRAAVRRIAGS